MNPLSLTFEELEAVLRQHSRRAGHRAADAYRALFRHKMSDWDRLPVLSELPRPPDPAGWPMQCPPLTLVARQECEGVIKLVYRLFDDLMVETVIIPMARHTTVCVSCQVGCRMGCRLCETGQMGLRRSLSAAEIVAQVHSVTLELGFVVRNVVFMGMGEPLDNFEPVIQAIRVLADQRGLNIALRRMTLSTAGMVDGIERLAALNWPHLKLAVSLNAAEDELRSALMPINRRYGLNALKTALQHYPLARGNVLLVEYVLIKGINDRSGHVDQIASFIHGLPVRLNLIPYHPRCNSPFEAPDTGDILRFQKALIRHGIFVRVRHSKGVAIQAACGQLGGAMDRMPG